MGPEADKELAEKFLDTELKTLRIREREDEEGLVEGYSFGVLLLGAATGGGNCLLCGFTGIG